MAITGPQDVEYREKPSKAGDLSSCYINGETEVLPSVLQLGSTEARSQALGFSVWLENTPRTGKGHCRLISCFLQTGVITPKGLCPTALHLPDGQNTKALGRPFGRLCTNVCVSERLCVCVCALIPVHLSGRGGRQMWRMC